MFKFIRYFIMEWEKYPYFMGYLDQLKKNNPEGYEKMREEDRARGIEPEYKSRFDYAVRNARIYYSHRDRYGRKCRKAGGNCEICKAKHC